MMYSVGRGWELCEANPRAGQGGNPVMPGYQVRGESEDVEVDAMSFTDAVEQTIQTMREIGSPATFWSIGDRFLTRCYVRNNVEDRGNVPEGTILGAWVGWQSSPGEWLPGKGRRMVWDIRVDVTRRLGEAH